MFAANSNAAFQRSDVHIYNLGLDGAKFSAKGSNDHFRYSNILFYGGGGDGVPIDFEMDSAYSLRDSSVLFKELDGGDISLFWFAVLSLSLYL